MALANVNLGSAPSAGDGSPLRTAFGIINDNFAQLQSNVSSLSNSVSSVAGRTGNIVLTVNDILGLSSTNYPNSAVIGSWITSNISALIGTAPGILDTLGEIADAINDDANVYNTLLGSITSANVGMKGYVDNELTSYAVNVAIQGWTVDQITESNVGLKGYVDNELTSYAVNVAIQGYIGDAITTANLGQIGYTDDAVSTANIGMIGYVGDAVDTANVGMKGYVDSQSHYSNVNLESYLTVVGTNVVPSANLTYDLGSTANHWDGAYVGNVYVNKQVIFKDQSEQFTAWTGSEHRTYFSSNVRYKPTWLSYYPGGDKTAYGSSFGFDAADGMFFAGNADYPAYPIRLNTGFHEDDKVEILTTIDFDNQGDDPSIAIFLANAEPQYSFTSNVTRIGWYSNFGTTTLSGQTGANVSPVPTIFAGNVYTVKFEYDRNVNPSVTVSTYLGSSATGSPVAVNTLNEQLPHGLFTVGFDGDNDTPGNNSKFSNVTVRTIDPIHTVNVAIQGWTTEQITQANVGMKGYVDDAVSTIPASYTDANVNTLLASWGSNTLSTTGNVEVGGILTDNYYYANGAPFIGGGGSGTNYTDANVVSLLSSFGSNSITTTGAVTAANFIGNVSLTGNITGTSANVILAAGDYEWEFDNTGNTTMANGTVSATTVNAVDLTLTGNISATVDGYDIGYKTIPQVTAGNVTLALTDSGKHYYSTSTAPLTLTVPSNANVAFPVGTAISIVNKGSADLTVDFEVEASMYLAGNATSASRTITSYGMATVMKTATDEWFINGTGIS
jgi:hypothetical protein